MKDTSSELYESREQITDPEVRTNIAQMQAFKAETIERYIAEQIPVIDSNVVEDGPTSYDEEDVPEEQGR